MTFTKPQNMKYTTMAMTFDKEFYTPNRDDDKLYQYMYFLIYMLACKKNYFKNSADYDKYALFSATVLYRRFMKKQLNGERVKSVLNYIKSTLHHLKVMYQNEAYAEVLNPEVDEEATEGVKNYLYSNVQADYMRPLRDDILDAFEDLPYIIKKCINQSPYKNDIELVNKIYKSCLLTFLNDITIENKKYNRISTNNSDKISSLLIKEKYSKPLLWKLDDSYSSYIRLLVNKSRYMLAKNIIESRERYMLSDDLISDIMASAYNTYGKNQADKGE